MRLGILGGLGCLGLFGIRVWMLGGLDGSYEKPEPTFLQPFQSYLASLIDQILPYPQNKVLAGMLLGVDKIPFGLKQQFKTTSTVHILVVSGQNLSILAGFLMTLAPFLGRKKTIFLSFLMIIFYSVLTGLGIPVIRAAIMATLVLAAQLFGKEGQSLWILGVTVIAMLLFNPNWLLSISFQLSVLATLGALIAPGLLDPYFQFVPSFIRQDVEVSLLVQLLILPIIGSNFGQLGLVGILANLFILWTVSLIMVLGILGVLGGLGSLVVGKVLGLGASVLISYMLVVISFFSSLPFAQVELPLTSLEVWIGYYLIIFAIGWKLVYLSYGQETT